MKQTDLVPFEAAKKAQVSGIMLVITSYSIHYTKLYDSAEGMNGTISELLAQNAMPSTTEQQIETLNKEYGGMDALGGPKLRITSYNVCYTKLLREALAWL